MSQQMSLDQLFNRFCSSISFQEILQLFDELCTRVGVDSKQYEGLYISLKNSLKSWKATSLYQLLDARASLPEYDGQKACAGKRVIVIGAGPVGLRGAIEVALLGAKVDVVEKRTEFTRNNCLHLWPFCIADLRKLGAKKIYSRFAYGTIEHISTKYLQSILLKICLMLGVKVHRGVSFDEIIEPKDFSSGWTVSTKPASSPVSSCSFDVILAADGNQNTLPGFRSKVFRPKLALGVTVNFVNHNTSKECAVRELGGLSLLHCQSAFATLALEHGIELENLVYFKDETHYFVMTAKKTSLLKKGVLKKDSKNVRELLRRDNVDNEGLASYAAEAATAVSGLQDVEFEINHRGEKDVAVFDFTTMHESENASRIIERKGKKLLLCVAGDTLLQPFWPSGTGCARGFLGVFDAAWMIKGFCVQDADPIKLLEEREAILTLLPQTMPFTLQPNLDQYSLNPKSRYKGLFGIAPRGDVKLLFDTDVGHSNDSGPVLLTRPTVPDEVGVSHDSSESDEDEDVEDSQESSSDSVQDSTEALSSLTEELVASYTDCQCVC